MPDSYHDLSMTAAELEAAVTSPYASKRVITLGHSLVSQVGWQAAMKGYLDLEGYSVLGISGGTIQPKPGESVAGMYSRAYMAGMLDDLINFADADEGGITTLGLTAGVKARSAATIFWAGANDSVTDLGNSPRLRLYLDRDFLASVTERATALSEGTYADTAAGLAATSNGEYFSVAGDLSGWSILYEHRVTTGSVAAMVYHYPDAGTDYDTDRIMTTAEQDEFEARNTTDGADAFLSEPLSNGFVVTYEALWHTMIANYLDATGFDDVPTHRFFIVREPQAFWKYDGTLDWPQGHYEKNEVHRRVADRWGFPLIDLWGESGINVVSRGWFLQNEASGELFIHVNDKGGRQCANVISKRLLQHPPLDFTGDADGSNLGVPTAAADLAPWAPDNVISAG